MAVGFSFIAYLPLLLFWSYLAASETGVPVKDLLRRRVTLHAPVKDRGLGHQSDGVQRDPLPEDDVVGHYVGLHLGLHLDVENLQGFLG